jgi:hypothetical protein
MCLREYDGTVIDPIWVDLAGRGEVEFPPSFYGACCRASFVFQYGNWKRRWREAEARNDFAALDRLDKEYERIGM